MISSLDPSAIDHRKQGVFIALLLALVMVFMGAKTGSLGQAIDHGLVGSSAERTQADSQPISEGATSAGETEDESELDTAWVARGSIEIQWFVAPAAHGLDVASDRGARRSCAGIGARGPPVG